MMPMPATAQKRMYLRNWNSYDNDSSLILKVINCTLTWNSKQEIDGQREMVPFLRSCHIFLCCMTSTQNTAVRFNNIPCPSTPRRARDLSCITVTCMGRSKAPPVQYIPYSTRMQYEHNIAHLWALIRSLNIFPNYCKAI